jgi:hypothetical protein
VDPSDDDDLGRPIPFWGATAMQVARTSPSPVLSVGPVLRRPLPTGLGRRRWPVGLALAVARRLQSCVDASPRRGAGL